MPYNVHFGARRSVVHDSMSDCMWLQLPSSQIEGCFLFLRYHLSLLQTLSLSICQSSCHLANISPVNPNIYPSSGKLHVCSHPLHSPHALSLHHLYIHLFTSSPLTDASQTERCSNIDILSLFVFNIKSDSDHSSLSLPSVHHQSSRCPLQTLVLRGVHISGGWICLCDKQTDDMLLCVPNQTGFITQRNQQKFSYLKSSQGLSYIIQD